VAATASEPGDDAPLRSRHDGAAPIENVDDDDGTSSTRASVVCFRLTSAGCRREDSGRESAKELLGTAD